ncbi:putative nuclease HARBI1 isoform X1 [Eriocheir sinensis]|uniref:putative nuclease HARBI1 isoform X1 n=1 Tax=Eriocheir sinensis TaxID=95602 RepID=UPI0021C5ABF6|nr:putative nuclease HARBI1 isoform X1 [Eriocheir sinensis]
MFNPWQQWEEFAAGQRALAALGRKTLRRERRVVPDRMNPFTAMSDREFTEQFRLKKESVNDIILKIGDCLPQSTDRRGCRVPPHLQVLLALAAMASGSHQEVIGDYFDVSQTTVSQCLARVASAIAGLIHQYITFPTGNMLHKVIEDFRAIAGMPGVVGCIDCTHFQIIKPPRNDSEIFKCKKGYFSLNIQAICGPDLLFYNIVSRWPGSVDDASIFENSRIHDDLQDGILPGHLLGDSGYSNRQYLLTPLLSPNGPHEERYNASHIQTRNTIDRAFGVLKRRFAYLGKSIRTNLETTKAIIVASAILHNIAVKTRLNMEDDINAVNENLQNNDLNVIENFVEARYDSDEVLQGRLKREQIIREHF